MIVKNRESSCCGVSMPIIGMEIASRIKIKGTHSAHSAEKCSWAESHMEIALRSKSDQDRQTVHFILTENTVERLGGIIWKWH